MRTLLLLACLAAHGPALACIEGRMEEVALTPERRAYHEKQLKSSRETIRELEGQKAPQGQINAWKRETARTEQILASGREEVFRRTQAKPAPAPAVDTAKSAKAEKTELARAASSKCSG